MDVRAKFECKQISGNEVVLDVVYDGSPENERFFKYTPSGQIRMGILNAPALAAFEVGKQYYVDFTPTEG